MYHSLFYGAWDESKCVRVRFSHAITINNFDNIDMCFLSIYVFWIFLLTLNDISTSNQTQSHLPQFYGESRHALLSNIFFLLKIFVNIMNVYQIFFSSDYIIVVFNSNTIHNVFVFTKKCNFRPFYLNIWARRTQSQSIRKMCSISSAFD